MSALPIIGEQGAGSGTLRTDAGLRCGTDGTAPRSPLSQVRAALLADVPALETLMAPYVATGDLLPRSNYDLCRHIKEYAVAVAAGGEIVGCGSLKIYSRGLAEVAGLAVLPQWQGAGVGRALLQTLTAEARAQGLHEVLA